jgi:hypothetical protein
MSGVRAAIAIAVVAALSAAPAAQPVAAPALKAAFLYNFVKFAEWPGLAAAAPIAACVVGDEGIADALAETVRGRNIDGHGLEVSRPESGAAWRLCHLLFIADAQSAQFARGKASIGGVPVLTVSDGKDFSRSGGMIELYLEGGQIRFAINVDAAERSGLRLSSRLLGLARIVRDARDQ